MNRPEIPAADLDAVLAQAVTADPGLPGVVAGLTTDRDTVYLGTAGVRAADGETPMTTDTVFALFSTTKPITATVALRLAEQGIIDLHAPAREYLPELGEIQVVDGFDDDGEPRLRAPRSDVTLHRLLTHTAGFGYTFFNETYARLAKAQQWPDVANAQRAALDTPLLFDPGTSWQYGANLDWAGLVLDAATGRRLDELMSELVLDPLGMTDTAFVRSDDMRARTATMHQRRPDGTLKVNHRFAMPDEPEVFMGGQGLYSTVGDYLKFIRLWLNDGRTDAGEPLLSAVTVAEAARDQLAGLEVTALPGVIPVLAHDTEFFPGIRKGWGLSFLINEEDAPTGRPAGSLGWAGLANLYFWIDRRNRIGGFWASQLLPFFDPAALDAALDFESAVYRASVAATQSR